MADTLRYLVDAVLTRLSMEDGLDVQVYTEDRIVAALQHKFDTLFDEYWFPQFVTFQEEWQLDGTTGQIVGDLSARIKKFADIQAVFNDYRPYPLPLAPSMIRLRDITNPCIQSVPDATKVFRVLPMDTSGSIYVSYRTAPDVFENDDDLVDMDRQAMILGTCWDILVDDGTNPGAEDKFRMLYDTRVKQLQKLQFNFPQTSTPRETIPTRWY